MAILNQYSKTTYVDGTTPDLNAANLNKNEQGVYDVTEKVRELAAYETNAAASAVSAASSAASAASAAAAACADLAEDVADLTTVVSNKANKTQSAWIDAPLIAPTVNFGGGYQTAQYMKDEFGVVHLRGVVKGGLNNSAAFILPVGYRPSANEVFGISQNNLFGTCIVFSNGEVRQVGNGVTVAFCFGNTSFVSV